MTRGTHRCVMIHDNSTETIHRHSSWNGYQSSYCGRYGVHNNLKAVQPFAAQCNLLQITHRFALSPSPSFLPVARPSSLHCFHSWLQPCSHLSWFLLLPHAHWESWANNTSKWIFYWYCQELFHPKGLETLTFCIQKHCSAKQVVFAFLFKLIHRGNMMGVKFPSKKKQF